MSETLDILHNALSSDLDRIRRRFKTAVKVTLIVRQPAEIRRRTTAAAEKGEG